MNSQHNPSIRLARSPGLSSLKLFQFFMLTFFLSRYSIKFFFVSVSLPELVVLSIFTAFFLNLSLNKQGLIKPGSNLLNVFWVCLFFIPATELISTSVINSGISFRKELISSRILSILFILAPWITFNRKNYYKIIQSCNLLYITMMITSVLTIIKAYVPELLPDFIIGRTDMDTQLALAGLHLTRNNALISPAGAWGQFTIPVFALYFFISLRNIQKGRNLPGLIFSFFIVFVAVLLTQSRSTWLAFTVASGLSWYFMYKEGHINRFLNVSFFIYFVFLVLFLGDDIYRWAFSLREYTAISRFEINRNAYVLFKQKPLWGHGVINFTSLPDYKFQAVIHNGFMYKLASTGLMGFIPYISLLLTAFYMSLQLIKKSNTDIIRYLGYGLIVGYVACLIELFFYRNVGHSFMWLLIGFIVILYKINREVNKIEG